MVFPFPLYVPSTVLAFSSRIAAFMSTSVSSAQHPLWISAAPFLFVLLWSTGFIGGKLGLSAVEPMTFLTLRYTAATLILLCIALLSRARWPQTNADVVHAAIAGLLLHLGFVGAVFYAYTRGVEAGVAAIIASLQPLLTAVIVGRFLGEVVTPKQWLGLFLGLAGVALVVWQKLSLGIGSPLGLAFAVIGLLGITSGTVYQKRFCSHLDLRTGNTIQFFASAAVAAVLAYLLETRQIEWTRMFILTLSWLTLVISVGAIALLYVLIRRGAVARVASLFYLVPLATALIAWPLFGETFGPIGFGGMGLTVIGVALAQSG